MHKQAQDGFQAGLDGGMGLLVAGMKTTAGDWATLVSGIYVAVLSMLSCITLCLDLICGST